MNINKYVGIGGLCFYQGKKSNWVGVFFFSILVGLLIILFLFLFFSSNQQSGLFWPCSLDFIISNLTESAIIWANSSEIQSGVSPSLFNALDPVLRNSSSAPSASSLLIWTSSAFKLGEKRSFLFRFLFLLERVLEKDEIISGH